MAALKCALVLCLFSQMSWGDASNPLDRDENRPIYPIPLNQDLNRDKLELGRLLYNDRRLSPNGQYSCASCHHLNTGGDDEQTSCKQLDPATAVNTPSIFNSKFNFRQNWDGSADSLPELLDMKLLKFSGSTNSWDELLARFNQDTQLISRFNILYQGKTITREMFTDALIYYVESLTTPNARFDQYLQGNKDAINENELRGYTLFKDYGCITCHQGVNIGGNLYQRFGIFYDYFRARGDIRKADYGRMNTSGNSTDAHVFKVPSLRNVELTAPYLHDGQIKSLEKIVSIMGRTQLGVEIDKKDVALIVGFLKTLTGDTSDFVEADQK